MPKKIVKRRLKQEEIADWKIKVLEDGLYPEGTSFEGLHFFYDDRKKDFKKDLYESIRNDFLKSWISDFQCSRPWAWYRYDAPRWTDDGYDGCYWHGKFAIPREHLSGGKKCNFRFVPQFHKAVFRYWHFTDENLPIFESEASYLRRLNLLTKAEKTYLEKHPELLEPESIINAIPGVQSQGPER